MGDIYEGRETEYILTGSWWGLGKKQFASVYLDLGVVLYVVQGVIRVVFRKVAVAIFGFTL